MYCLTSINDFIVLVNGGGAIIGIVNLTVNITLFKIMCYYNFSYCANDVNLKNEFIYYEFSFYLVNYLLTYFGY